MNFFGHCVVASWQSRSPGFALGAMLPDFATMCGARVAGAESDEVARGLDCHHRTDRAFHAAPEFCELTRRLAERLRRRGTSRGGALGAAHVGIELLLDGLLLDEPAAAALYPRALSAGRGDRLGRLIHFGHPSGAERWLTLRRRLEDYGLPLGYRDPAEVGRRVTRILSRRPRLALDARGQAALDQELPPAQGEVAARLPSLIARLRADLGADQIGSPGTSAESAGRRPPSARAK